MIRNIVFTESLFREDPKTPDCPLRAQSNAPDGTAFALPMVAHSAHTRRGFTN